MPAFAIDIDYNICFFFKLSFYPQHRCESSLTSAFSKFGVRSLMTYIYRAKDEEDGAKDGADGGTKDDEGS